MRVEFFSCVRVLAYCCMTNHIHAFIYLDDAQTLPKKPRSPLQRYRLLRKGKAVLS